jgi:fructose-bisphosphate aldolase class II
MHQDHGTSPPSASVDAQRLSSVMMDGSLEDGKTPSATTTTSTSPARWSRWPTIGVSVEGELGCLGSLETGGRRGRRHRRRRQLDHEQMLTDPEEAADFVKQTVDALAIAIGTSHGAYKFTKPTGDILAIDRIKEIHARIPTPTWSCTAPPACRRSGWPSSASTAAT